MELEDRHHTNSDRLVVWKTRLAVTQSLLSKSRQRHTFFLGKLLCSFIYLVFSNAAGDSIQFHPQTQTGMNRHSIEFGIAAGNVAVFKQNLVRVVIPLFTQPFTSGGVTRINRVIQTINIVAA